MKKIKILFMVVATLLLATGCEKEKTDIGGLLSTVPSSAGGVIGFNISSMLSKAGMKVENGKVSAGKDTKSLLSALSPEQKDMFEAFLDGETGVDPTGAIIFYDLNRTYLTYGLNDTEAFRNYIEKKCGAKFSETSGVDICGNIAVKGPQVWMVLGQNSVDPVVINGYSSLSQSQSFLQTGVGEKIREMSHDIYGWGKIGIFTSKYMTFNETTIFNLFSSSMFEDAEEIVFKAEFEKGEFEAKLKVLNSKGKVAKYLLPADKIDAETIKSLGGNADVVVAGAISPKLVKKLEKLGTTMGGPSYKLFETYLNSIDGTVAVAMADPSDLYSNINGVVTVKGDVSMAMKTFLSSFAAIRVEDKFVKFNKGTMNGSLTMEKAAEELKGACVGIISDCPVYPLSEASAYPFINKSFNAVDYYCIKLEPEDGSVSLEIEIEGKNKNENILLSFLKANAAAASAK